MNLYQQKKIDLPRLVCFRDRGQQGQQGEMISKNFPNKLSYTQMLHQVEKPGFWQMPLADSLYFWLRNPVSSALLRKVQDVNIPIGKKKKIIFVNSKLVVCSLLI